jgi:hypothetical protein
VEDPMAEEFLAERFADGDTISIGLKDKKISFSKVNKVDEAT